MSTYQIGIRANDVALWAIRHKNWITARDVSAEFNIPVGRSRDILLRLQTSERYITRTHTGRSKLESLMKVTSIRLNHTERTREPKAPPGEWPYYTDIMRMALGLKPNKNKEVE